MTGVQTCALPICFPVTIASTLSLLIFNAFNKIAVVNCHEMNFLKHFCTHATSLKKQMAGKLVSVHPYIHHFCFGKSVVKARSSTVERPLILPDLNYKEVTRICSVAVKCLDITWNTNCEGRLLLVD